MRDLQVRSSFALTGNGFRGPRFSIIHEEYCRRKSFGKKLEHVKNKRVRLLESAIFQKHASRGTPMKSSFLSYLMPTRETSSRKLVSKISFFFRSAKEPWENDVCKLLSFLQRRFSPRARCWKISAITFLTSTFLDRLGIAVSVSARCCQRSLKLLPDGNVNV